MIQIELKNSNITNNTIEATINCSNNNCSGFIRNEVDGETKYYEILSSAYSEDSGGLLLTPEDRSEIEINKYNTTAKDHIEDHIDKSGIYHISAPFTGKKNNDKVSLCDLRFIFIVIIIVVIITLRVQKILNGGKNYLKGAIRNNI